MSLSFYLDDDGQLAPHPAAFSARRAIQLQAPVTVWRRPSRHGVIGRLGMVTALVALAALLIATKVRAGEAFEAVRSAAMHGEYQAQRNVAYGYTSAPYPGQDKNELLGCAWRLVILHSGSQRVDSTDVDNAKMYCGRLESGVRVAAQEQGRTLFRQIYRRAAPF